MYYILYDLKTLKVKRVYTKPLTAKVCDNFYEINSIAEYKGELPKNDWLTVDNVHEEIETWKEKQTQVKTITELEPREVQKVVFEEKETFDENGVQVTFKVPKVIEETIEVEVEKEVEEEIEVEKSKTHVVCDLVAHFYPKTELTEEQKLEREKKRLRQLREKECFALVNRGELWYKRLTDEQKAELDVWYQSWLDVTETLEIPNKPDWLK